MCLGISHSGNEPSCPWHDVVGIFLAGEQVSMWLLVGCRNYFESIRVQNNIAAVLCVCLLLTVETLLGFRMLAWPHALRLWVRYFCLQAAGSS